MLGLGVTRIVAGGGSSTKCAIHVIEQQLFMRVMSGYRLMIILHLDRLRVRLRPFRESDE